MSRPPSSRGIGAATAAATSLVLAIIAFIAMGAAGCRGRSPAGDRPGDAEIARAANAEERSALEQARDDIEAEMKQQAADKDAEIARLTRENDELKRQLAGK